MNDVYDELLEIVVVIAVIFVIFEINGESLMNFENIYNDLRPWLALPKRNETDKDDEQCLQNSWLSSRN